MTPERHEPDDPREWLNRARGNLIRARAKLAGVYLEDLCFDAQQAAEKALKAVFIHCRLDFPYTHDLGRLVTILQQQGEAIPLAVEEARRLTPYASLARYPAWVEPVTEVEHTEAVALAQTVVDWAENRLTKPA